MRKVSWEVAGAVDFDFALSAGGGEYVCKLIERVDCGEIFAMAFDFTRVAHSENLWGRLVREVGLRAEGGRFIGSGYQLKLSCGVVINFYKTGSVMAQGRFEEKDVRSIERLYAVLHALKMYSKMNGGGRVKDGVHDEF